MQDMITALAVPPGNSPQMLRKWPWEQPPRFADPDDAIDFITDSIAEGPGCNDMLATAAGITVEELVNQVSFKGFMSGAISPDVAELIKPAVAVFLRSGNPRGIRATDAGRRVAARGRSQRCHLL